MATTAAAAPTVDQQASQNMSTGRCLGFPRRVGGPNYEEATDSHDAANDLSLVQQHLEDVSKVLRDLDELSQKNNNNLTNYRAHVESEIEEAKTKLDSFKPPAAAVAGSNQTQTEDEQIPQFRKAVTKLKLDALSKYKNQSSASDSRKNKDSNGSKTESIIKQVSESKNLEALDNLNLFKNEEFHSTQVTDFEEIYNKLTTEQKMCLLSFSVFPENKVISKRFLIYWWVGEGFVASAHKANNVFRDLLDMRLIEPVTEKPIHLIEKRIQQVKKCKIHPFVRYMLILRSKMVNFLDFDEKGRLMPRSSSGRACLILKDRELPDPITDPTFDKIQILFNVDSDFLDFKPEFLQRMTNSTVISLGRWQSSQEHHIEVEDVKFFDGFRNTKFVKLLSLQGISGITKLPDSIKMLESLTILDLRACHNLEQIPNEIGALKSLTVLDMSECFLLDHLPKEINSLKGFVVREQKTKNQCTLQDLMKLSNLRKLGIYTGLRDFPKETDLKTLFQLDTLQKLKIEWGGDSQKKPNSNTAIDETQPAKAANKQESRGASSAIEDTQQRNPGSKTSRKANDQSCDNPEEGSDLKTRLIRIPNIGRKRERSSEYNPAELPTTG